MINSGNRAGALTTTYRSPNDLGSCCGLLTGNLLGFRLPKYFFAN